MCRRPLGQAHQIRRVFQLSVNPKSIHRLGVGAGILGIEGMPGIADMLGIDGMPGIGDMLGMLSIGIFMSFMSFIIDSQHSFISLADISTLVVEP